MGSGSWHDLDGSWILAGGGEEGGREEADTRDWLARSYIPDEMELTHT